jgi:cytochrome c oxidase subunit 2
MHISPVLWQFLVKWLTLRALSGEASTIAPTPTRSTSSCSDDLVGLLLVGALVFGFSIRYRKRRSIRSPRRSKARRCSRRPGRSFRWPSSWSRFVWGALLYFRIYNPPANAMNIYVVGKQWMWKAEHPGGQHEINALHVPTGRPCS